jgi:hypothetical protein
MGSFGREEPCPFSDLELMILIEKDDEGTTSYFKLLIQCLDLQMRSLGESPGEIDKLGIVFRCIHQKTPLGFHLDLGHAEMPEKMAELQSKDHPNIDDPSLEDPNTLAHTALKSTSLSRNSPTLFEKYQSEKKTVLANTKREDISLHQYRALRYVKKRVNDYQKVWKSPFLPSEINLKTHYVEK